MDCIITRSIRFTCQALFWEFERFGESAPSLIARLFYGFHIDTIIPFFYSALSRD